MSQRIYCISGLGADERIFSNLKLPGYELCFVQWIEPLPKESFQSYAQRMLVQISDSNPVLLGVSFGGMLAAQISQIIPVSKLILISTVTTRSSLPWWMHLAGTLRLHKLVKPRPHPLLYPIENYFLGARTKSEVELAIHFREHANKVYLQWAINEIVTWANVTMPANYIQIHGTADKLFPVKKSGAAHIIRKGGHFMVYNRAEEVSRIILHELENVNPG